jgi:hypothetical protein
MSSKFGLEWFKEQMSKLKRQQDEIASKIEELEKEEEIKNEEEECDCDDEDWNDDFTDWGNMEEEEEDSFGNDFDVDRQVYTNLKMVNDVLTIVLNDGNIISKPNATYEDFKAAQSATSEEELFVIVMSQEARADKRKLEADIEKAKAMQKGLDLLNKFRDFELDGDSVVMRGTGRTMPQILVEEFLLIISSYENYSIEETELLLYTDEKYQALKRFFMWCCLNPRAEVAHELYRFLKENSFRITKQGFFVALRNVVSLCDDTELVDFVSNTYNKIKAIWKKDPSKQNVWRDNNGELFLADIEYSGEGFELVGNLTTLYLDLPNMKSNRYTDDWTKTFDIRVGQPVSMPLSECNWSTQDCAAAGLHFTSDQIHYVGCGDTSMLILINPMKVVGIGEHKGRCYEYLPLMTVPREEATQILHDLDFDTLELDDDYAIRELQGLAERARAGFIAESRKYSFHIPTISTKQIDTITLTLEEMMGDIVNRIKNMD